MTYENGPEFAARLDDAEAAFLEQAGLRQPAIGPLDVEATATAAGVEVCYRRMHETTEGLTLSGRRVYINESLPLSRKRFVFGHELAHALIKRGALPWAPRGGRAEEAFADQFAARVLRRGVDTRDGVRRRHPRKLHLIPHPMPRRTSDGL